MITRGDTVKHAVTGAEGRVEHVVDHLSPYDGFGPWARVAFNDGLTCWVPEAVLLVECEHASLFLAIDGPAYECDYCGATLRLMVDPS